MKISQEFYDKSKSLLISSELTKKCNQGQKFQTINVGKLSTGFNSTLERKNNPNVKSCDKVGINLPNISDSTRDNLFSQRNLAETKHKVMSDKLNTNNIIGLNKIMSLLDKKKEKIKTIFEDNKHSVIFDKKFFDKNSNKRIYNLKLFKNSKINDLNIVNSCLN